MKQRILLIAALLLAGFQIAHGFSPEPAIIAALQATTQHSRLAFEEGSATRYTDCVVISERIRSILSESSIAEWEEALAELGFALHRRHSLDTNSCIPIDAWTNWNAIALSSVSIEAGSGDPSLVGFRHLILNVLGYKRSLRSVQYLF